MERSSPHFRQNIRKRLTFYPYFLRHPLAASRKINAWTTIKPGLFLVGGFGTVLALLFIPSALAHDYPPPPDILALWIEAWGEFTMLPFLKIPPEQYRLFLVFATLPAILTAWILMAGVARLLAVAFGKQISFDSLLNLLAMSFFPFWILSALLDILYSGILADISLAALRGAYGSGIKAFFVNFPPWMYIIPFSLGGLYNGLAVCGAGMRWWQALITGCLTFALPMLLAAFLFR